MPAAEQEQAQELGCSGGVLEVFSGCSGRVLGVVLGIVLRAVLGIVLGAVQGIVLVLETDCQHHHPDGPQVGISGSQVEIVGSRVGI